MTVTPSRIEIIEGESAVLSASVSPEAASDRAVAWSSSDRSVATVDKAGTVHGLRPGTATVTATAEGKSGTCAVTVKAKAVNVTEVTLDKTELTLTEGETETLTATVKPDNADNRKVTWSSDKTEIATVDGAGKVTAVKPGEAVVTVTTEDGGKTATCKVTVKAKVIGVTEVTLDRTELTLTEGETETLTATVRPDNADNRKVTWSSDKTEVATVDGAGRVTAVKAGICTVTATAGGKSASCTVNIAQAETAQLIYTLPAETELTSGFDTGLKLLEHASTESPQYTILVDAKAGDNFDASTWPAFLHCLTETGSTANLPGFNSTSSPLNNKTEFAYYNYGGVTLSDSIEHLKTRTRYVVQLDGKKYRGGSTYCPMTEWLTCNGTITDVPQTFLIGAAQSTDGSKKQQFWPGTLYQCKVYKGLLSDNRIKAYINKGW